MSLFKINLVSLDTLLRKNEKQQKIRMDPERTLNNDCVALAFKIEVNFMINKAI